MFSPSMMTWILKRHVKVYIYGYTGDCAACISISVVLMVVCSINANDVRGCQELEEGAGGVEVRERKGARQLCHFHILPYVQLARENCVYWVIQNCQCKHLIATCMLKWYSLTHLQHLSLKYNTTVVFEANIISLFDPYTLSLSIFINTFLICSDCL